LIQHLTIMALMEYDILQSWYDDDTIS
jgi:hypothetical protein